MFDRRYLGTLLLLCGAVSIAAGGIPLEWNSNRPTDVPYEVVIDKTKINRITQKDITESCQISADVNGKPTPIAVTLLDGNQKDKVRLRFIVPNGTTALSCVPGIGKISKAHAATCENIFIDALNDPQKWQCGTEKGKKLIPEPKLSVTRNENGLLFKSDCFGTCVARYTVDVPQKLAGKPVLLELTLQSKSKMVWSNPIRVIQYDKNGKVLPVSVTDPRWISHMRPPETVTRYSEPGIIHSQAAKLAFELKLHAIPTDRDNYGMPLKDKTANLPRLLLTELAMREAFELPFPRYRDGYFGSGVSGKDGDASLKLDGKSLFFYATTGQGTWAESHQVRKIEESYYPFGDGTIECCFKPEVWKDDCVLISSANVLNRTASRYLPKRGELFSISYNDRKKSISLFIKDNADKVFRKNVKTDIPTGKWTHIAAQWSKKGGVQLFVNGKKIIDNKTFSYTELDTGMDYPVSVLAHQLTIGNKVNVSRGSGTGAAFDQNFTGEVDLLRVSSKARYSGNFVPEKNFTVDDDTRALFNFDRTFDGTTAGEMQFISGSTLDWTGRRSRKITYNGKAAQYIPEKIADDSHHDKVLCRLNYPVVPKGNDFKNSYIRHSKSLNIKPGTEFSVECPEDVRMDSIEYTNLSAKTLGHPIIVGEKEIDPRSFGDIADGLDLAGTPHRERAYRIFNFVLGASDYFMNHQIDFNAFSKKPVSAEYLALVMLNGYCGFECGPLNNLAAMLFSCSGLIPAVQTAGFGHSFEQCFYDGGSRLYDLSAQKFFPSFDNESAASLAESEREPGTHVRTGGSPDHFIRLSLRGHNVNNPGFMDKVGVAVKNGETFRIFFSNDGTYNDLQSSRVFESKKVLDAEKYNDVLGIKTRNPIYRIPRVFPHFANAFLLFNGKPAKHKSAFSNIKNNSFCYDVNSSYPIVGAEYSAKLENGKYAEIELSVDGGKTFSKLKSDADSKYKLAYEVMARHTLKLKINAPISAVSQFKASTKMMVNPRVLTGKLKKGTNKLTFKATSGSDVRVTLKYSTKSAPITVDKVVSYGGIPGYERQLAAVSSGGSTVLNVKGVSSKASVTASEGFEADLKNGKLTIKAKKENNCYFGQVIIKDGYAEKRLVVIAAPGIKLLTADQAKLSGGAKLIDDASQKIIAFNNDNAKAVFKCDIPAGKYQIWNLNRFESHISAHHGSMGYKKRYLQMTIGNKKHGIGSTGNTCCDFYKAQFAAAGERSRFKWDFPLSDGTTYPYHRPDIISTNGDSEIVVDLFKTPKGGAELAALLIVPAGNKAFVSEMVKHLCGLNNEKWLITESNNEYFK